MPIELDHRLRLQPAAMAAIEHRGHRLGQLKHLVQHRHEQFGGRHHAIGEPRRHARNRRFFAMGQKHAAADRAARAKPARQLRAIGVTGVIVDPADSRRDLDLLALDAHRLGALLQKAAERAMGLIADQQHGAVPPAQPALQMMTDAAGVAHAAGGDDDVKAVQPGDRLALVDGLGEAQLRGIEQPLDIDAAIEIGGVAAEHFGRPDRQRRIEEHRRLRHLAALHQLDQIDDQLLGALDRKGRDQQRALLRRCFAHLASQPRAALLRRGRRPVGVAIGGFADHIIEAGRRFRIGLQQLGIGAKIAGRQHAQRRAILALAGEFDLDRRRAEQMAGVPIAGAHAGNDFDPAFVIDRPE